MAVTIVQCTVPNLSALEVVRAVSHVRGAGDVVVDLAAVRFARPADLTVLLSQLQRLVDLGFQCRLIRPIDDDVARYLTRMDVADAGVGVLATLRPRGATTDAEAVDMALVGTSELGPERGRGLPSLVEALAGTGGTGSLWSGSARVRLDGHRPAVAAPSLQGTLVSFTVSSGAPRSSRPSPSNGYHEW